VACETTWTTPCQSEDGEGYLSDNLSPAGGVALGAKPHLNTSINTLSIVGGKRQDTASVLVQIDP
jgi:hypothetical protein